MQAIEQFRARYPQGGLVSEFVILDRGGYLVKATVEADGTTLATGLAAAETIEAAEDRARDRALAALGIGPVNLSRPLPPLATELGQGLNPPLAQPPSPQPVQVTSQATGQAIGQTAETGVLPRSLEVKPFPDLPAPTGTDFGPERVPNLPWERDEPVAMPAEPSEPAAVAPKPQAKTKKSAKAAAPAPEPVAPESSPLGATEIVTRAKAELKRLGWTREQGQKFLLERYGKRETRQLDDREWRDLYDYLYQQPNPTRSGGVS